MSRRFKGNKEPEDSIRNETKEEPKEETFAERRKRRLAEREKQRQSLTQTTKEQEQENNIVKEVKEEKKEPIRYTRRFRTSHQQKPKEEEKEINKDKNNNNNDINNNININNNKKEKEKEKENEKKILEMKKEYDKIKETNKNIITKDLEQKEEQEEQKEKDNEENIVVDISGQAFNTKLEELSKLAKTTQLDYFFEGTYCDIKDPNTNQWKTGLVLERTDTEAKIKYYYSNINKTIFTYNVSDAIDKDIAMFRKYTQEENYYYNNAYQKMKHEAVTNPKLFEAKAALKVLCSMKNFSNKEFDEAFESPLEIIQELRGKLYYIFLNIINDNFQFEYVEERKIRYRK